MESKIMNKTISIDWKVLKSTKYSNDLEIAAMSICLIKHMVDNNTQTNLVLIKCNILV